MFLEDLQLIYKYLKKYQKHFKGFDIISKTYQPDDEFTEWDGEPGDFFEVEFQVQSINHFWFMAQHIGQQKKPIIL